MKRFIDNLYIVILLMFGEVLYSQGCTTCSFNTPVNDTSTFYVAAIDSGNYIINNGKTLCITSKGKFRGSITLNGGVICNNGYFTPVNFTFFSGEFINSKNAKLISNFSLTSNRTLINSPMSIFSVIGNLEMGGGTLNNEGIINVRDSLQNNTGSLSNRSIINCKRYTGTNAVLNFGKGIINTN